MEFRNEYEYGVAVEEAQKAKRDKIIFKLAMLGWTQEEIAKVIGITRQRVEQIANNGEIAKICNSISDWLNFLKICTRR